MKAKRRKVGRVKRIGIGMCKKVPVTEIFRRVTLREGLKRSLNIADVSEVFRCAQDECLDADTYYSLVSYLGRKRALMLKRKMWGAPKKKAK